MTVAAKIRVLIVVMGITPFLVLSVLIYVYSLYTRDQSEFRRIVAWSRWIESELIEGVRVGEYPDLAGRDEFVAVLDADQRVILSSSTALAVNDEPVQSLAAFEVAAGDQATAQLVTRIITTADQERRYVVYGQPVLRAPPRPEYDLRRLAPLITVVLTLGFAALGATVVMRDFSLRLVFLQEATHRIATGDLITPVRVKHDDELAQLAGDLERMRNSMRENEERRARILMGLSHDLGTPLTTIKGYVEAMQDGVLNDVESMNKAFEAIATKSNLLQDRINQLIEFSRLDSHALKMRRDRVRAAEYFDSVAQSIRSDIELSGRRFESSVRMDRDTVIEVDPVLMERVFENLYQNAVRYTRSGDRVRLAAKGTEDGFELRLDDSGPGYGEIDPEELFEPFRRGSNGRNEPGTGFGLTTVRTIIEMHGFTVRAEKSPLGGAAVVIQGPVAQSNRLVTT